MNLSNSFTLEELVFSETAVRKGLANDPTTEQIENLKILAQGLERIQALLGYPLHINSAYRSPKVNSAIGGSPTSAHMDGNAGDFTCGAFGTPLEICRAIATSDIDFDQCIQEGSWVHFSVAPAMRRKLLTAHFDNGKVTYTEGLA